MGGAVCGSSESDDAERSQLMNAAAPKQVVQHGRAYLEYAAWKAKVAAVGHSPPPARPVVSIVVTTVLLLPGCELWVVARLPEGEVQRWPHAKAGCAAQGVAESMSHVRARTVLVVDRFAQAAACAISDAAALVRISVDAAPKLTADSTREFARWRVEMTTKVLEPEDSRRNGQAHAQVAQPGVQGAAQLPGGNEGADAKHKERAIEDPRIDVGEWICRAGFVEGAAVYPLLLQ